MNLKKIETARKQLGLTQESLAEKLGIPQYTYSRIISGDTKCPVDLLPKLASELSLSIDEMFPQDKIITNQSSNKGTQIVCNENNNADIKELYISLIKEKNIEIERIIQQKDVEIKRLIDQLEKTISLVSKNS